VKRKLYKVAVLLLLATLIAVIALVAGPIYYTHAENSSLEALARHSHEVTAIEVLRLSHSAETASAGSYRIPINLASRNIVSRQTLTGSRASELLRIWGSIRLARDYIPMCHDPGFVLRFLAGQRCVFEVAVCLDCENASWWSSAVTPSIRGMIPESFDKNSHTEALKTFLTQLP
jgi:Tfp pilus assembly major pilin PilA